MNFNTLIDCETLAGRLGDPSWCVFDCRFDLADTQRGERAHAATHVPGAFYAHIDRDLSGPITPQSGRHPLPDPALLCDWLGRHGVGSDTQVVVYDDSGGTMAVRLWWLLRWLGHTRVAVLDGGWPAWKAAAMPVEDTPPQAASATSFAGQPDWKQVVTTATIATQLETRGAAILVMDARTRERFRGDAEPIDPVAGHIPNAINVPLVDNLDRNGRFKDPAALHALYAPALAGRPASDVAAMCGSGVTACLNLLAMEIAGLQGGRLYAGSWSEWIRDPGRPVATGD
ncbi:MAG: sulfurtransferase [Chromatiaceae bacterium]|nr:sulfurtransferase [Gammaproteobacteria bacterium]MCP5316672.1 sulfurtransferase [Chromatiaceae bacterium]MCW5586891.1 sulfurtransferase [Chromatiales bacterium]HOP16211.1 sulfurtransferase [Gammaproteobacteria bacterium]HPQ24715.1 sulfurtransferase [Gammaproteobacteria bacterium]